jgi:hypothetical protein
MPPITWQNFINPVTRLALGLVRHPHTPFGVHALLIAGNDSAQYALYGDDTLLMAGIASSCTNDPVRGTRQRLRYKNTQFEVTLHQERDCFCHLFPYVGFPCFVAGCEAAEMCRQAQAVQEIDDILTCDADKRQFKLKAVVSDYMPAPKVPH